MNSLSFRFSVAAIGRGGAVNLVDGTDILLHVKPRPDRHQVVLNTCIDGRWGQEQRIALPPDAFERDLLCTLSRGATGLSVGVEGAEPLEHAVEPERLARAELTFSPQVELLDDGTAPEALDLACEILVADTAHVRARLRFLDQRQMAPSRLGGVRLLLHVDGRPVRARPLARGPDQGMSQTQDIRFDLDSDAFVGEEMEARILLERPDGPHPLAQRTIRSRFVGWIEHCSETVVSGFAINPNLPAVPVFLDVFVGERYEGTVRADEARPDLAESDPKAAAGGFRFHFRQPLLVVAGADLAVSVRPRDTDIELGQSPWRLSRTAAPEEVLRRIRSARPAAPRRDDPLDLPVPALSEPP